MVSWFYNKELSLGADVEGWNSLKKKKVYIHVLYLTFVILSNNRPSKGHNHHTHGGSDFFSKPLTMSLLAFGSISGRFGGWLVLSGRRWVFHLLDFDFDFFFNWVLMSMHVNIEFCLLIKFKAKLHFSPLNLLYEHNWFFKF